MARVTKGVEWTIPASDAEVDRAVNEVASQHELSVRRSGDALELSGGSQGSMRLKGAWASKPSALPKKGRVTLKRSADADGLRVRLDLEDTMGFGFMDKKTRRKYDEVLDAIVFTFETAMTGLQQAAPEEPASGAAAGGMTDELEHLADLHERGALTDDEFAAAKQKLLAP